MAANKQQGSYFSIFLAGLTVACGGIAYVSSGVGKLAVVIGVALLLASLSGFLRTKASEGKTAQPLSSAALKGLGAFVSLFGWILVLLSLHVITSTGGRIVAALLGIGVTLFGIIYILPTTFNKNAIWKN